MHPDWGHNPVPQATNQVCFLTSTAMAQSNAEAKQPIHSHESSSQNTRKAMEQWMMDGCSQRGPRETQSRLWRHTPERASWRMAFPAHIAGRAQPIRGKGPHSECGNSCLAWVDGAHPSATARIARAGPGQGLFGFCISISQFLVRYGMVCTVRCGVAQG